MAHPLENLGRRERQIMEIVLSRGRASAGEVHKLLPEAPTYSAVRGMLRLLEAKGHLRHEKVGRKYVYLPATDAEEIARRAFHHVVETFFDNSVSSALATMVTDDELPDDELRRLQKLVAGARKRRRGGEAG